MLISLVALPALGLLAYTGIERRNTDAELARSRAVQIARDVGAEYLRVVTSTQALIRPVTTLLSQTSSLAEVPPDVCIAFFGAYLGSDTPYASVHLVAPDGAVSCASKPLNESISFAETSAFHMAMQSTEALVGTYQLDPLSGEGTLPIMQSIIGAGGSPIGVMAFMLRLSHLDLAGAVDELPAGSYATLVDANGTILARHPDTAGALGSVVRDSTTFARVVTTGEGVFDAVNRDGVDSLVGYSRLDPYGSAFVLVGTPREAAYAEANAALRRNLSILGVLALTGLTVAWLGTDRLVLKPLHRVVEVADRIESGEPGARVGSTRGAGELSALARAFDSMAGAVERREAQIAELNASLERRVADRTAELTIANKELESFSYTVSHDLRAPLRAIDGFSGLLLSRHGSDLSEEAHGFVRRVRAAAVRMGTLIDDLLQFSRLTRADLVRRPISMDALVAEVIEEVSDPTGDRSIEWRVGELGIAEADPALMRRVLANLLGNAIKFSRDRSPTVIEVGRTETADGEDAYFVRDNGVGFDMAHAGQIFGVFQRLHLQEEFEGTGIGLATVERIIRRHDGQVWAEAAPGQGATFFFTLGAGRTDSDQRDG